MPIIAGLGNIGSQYADTRHNIGFEVVNNLADSLNLTLGPGKGPFYIAEGQYRGHKIILLTPTTYMNHSGTAIRKALEQFRMEPSECLVCYDDINLPTGKIRLRPNGGDGGHNGISDIIYKIGTEDFPRLRIGIGNNFEKGEQVHYVLSPFNDDELPIIKDALTEAEDAVYTFIREGIEKAMNKHN